MSRSFSELEQEVMQLDLDSRATLAGKLLGSLHQESAHVDQAWLAEAESSLAEVWERELDARLMAVDAGDFAPGTTEDVFRRVRESRFEARK